MNIFAKSKKYMVIALFLAAAVLSVVLVGKVSINYNISDYLNEDSETKISLEILKDEFGTTSDVQVMIEDITVETAKEIQNTLKGIENVLTVSFNETDEGYYKNGNALFTVLVDGDEYSETANDVVAAIRVALDETFDGKISYGGAVSEKASIRSAIESEIPFILVISVLLAIAIMLLTSASWIEPIVLLMASGVAILINMGTNLILGEISYITNAVAAILQLALSIDYSIVLLHSYRAMKESGKDDSTAMRLAIKDVVKPVSASALTTIAGLLALLFMSFRIGFDIGSVLMKSIVISAITSLTLLPALLLVFDKLMKKTAKRDLVLKGRLFCKISFKASKIVVPIALVLVIACGGLQFGNAYSFTDGQDKTSKINSTFGQSNTVVVVYPNGDNNHASEIALANKLNAYKTADGKLVLKNYTAYSNTVRALYDVELAAQKLNIPVSDVEMLFTMQHLYGDSSLVEIKPIDFIKYTDDLLANDTDVQSFSDAELVKTIRTILMIDQMMNGEHTAEEFYTLTTAMGADLSLFSIQQMYGTCLYDGISDKTVDFETMLNFMIAASENPVVSTVLDAQSVAGVSALSQGIKQFNTLMETPLTQEQFRGNMYQNFGVVIDEMTAAQIYAYYYMANGQEAQSTIPFLNLMTFLVAQSQISDPVAVATVNGYHTLYQAINTKYSYEAFLPALVQITQELSGVELTLAVDNLAVQQLYIMYFNAQNMIPNTAISGRSFVEVVKAAATTNPIVEAQISESSRAKLADIGIVDAFLSDTTVYDYKEMAIKLAEMQASVQSISSSTTLSSEKVSGIYIKFSLSQGLSLTDAIEAQDLLAFVIANRNHELLKLKVSGDMRTKVLAAQAEMNKATELFVGENYSRMLLSIDLPNESDDSTAFVEFLTGAVKETFGDEAHIAGLMVSTYDLQETFDKDNAFISIFTIISIFMIVMIVFRSLSLPVVLVALIQGAIWIAMSTSLLTGPMFFMSYIVATCILMGATIDYGILMSTNYVQYRATYDRKEALFRSVAAAMPTVFTSGLILTICGFVIGFISSQNTIATVGLLLGKGTLVSVLMITLVLPSFLYLLDAFILKLSMKKKNK